MVSGTGRNHASEAISTGGLNKGGNGSKEK